MQIGSRASTTRAFSRDDIAAFLELAGDSQPPAFVPEPLVGALFSYLLGVELPGFGTNYLKQELRFLAPATIGEPLTATVEVTGVRPEKFLVDLATACTDSRGALVCRGRALVLVRDVAR